MAFVFEGLEEARRQLVGAITQSEYVTVSERKGGGSEEQIGRLDLDEASLSAWTPAPRDDWQAMEQQGPMETIDIVMGWIEERIRAIAISGAQNYRVRAMGPKGVRNFANLGVVCRYEPEGGTSTDSPVSQTWEMQEIEAAKPGFLGLMNQTKLFGELMSNWGAITQNVNLNALRAHSEIFRADLDRLREENKALRLDNEKMIAAYMELKFEWELASQKLQFENAEQAMKYRLFEQTFNNVGDMFKVWLSTQGLDESQAETLKIVAGHPGMSEALKDPALKELLQQPGFMDQLAKDLKGIAQMQAQQQQAQQPPPQIQEETPAPVVESPAPVVESPAPVVESPAPVVETPELQEIL